MHFQEALTQIPAPDSQAMSRVRQRIDSMAKPLHSLGKLEDLLVKAGGVFSGEPITFTKRCVVTMCADNGILEEGVTQTGRDVTTIMTESIAAGKATVNVIAGQMDADVFPVDIGVYDDPAGDALIRRKIRRGTRNFAKEPAMTREEAIEAIETGIQLVKDLKDKGYRLIATGEMGIGNTTTSSAMTAVFLDKDPAEVTGRGAGLTKEGILHKADVIRGAIAKHQPDKNDPLDVLCKVGGLDIAGMIGLFLGGGVYRVPIVVDGFISSVAAFTAVKMCPNAIHTTFASHVSKEPAGRMVLDALGLDYLLDCGMCLGEGTGAAASFALFDLALAIYNQMSSFDDLNIVSYKPL